MRRPIAGDHDPILTHRPQDHHTTAGNRFAISGFTLGIQGQFRKYWGSPDLMKSPIDEAGGI